MTLREAWKAEVEIRVYQLIAVMLVLLVIWAGGIYGLWRYVEEQTAVELRDDIAQCQWFVDQHNSLIGVLVARSVLDVDYPLLDVADCVLEG